MNVDGLSLLLPLAQAVDTLASDICIGGMLRLRLCGTNSMSGLPMNAVGKGPE